MSDNTTNRERLLRLIDGGPDATKELHQERLSKITELAARESEQAAVQKPEPVLKPAPATPAPVSVSPEMKASPAPSEERNAELKTAVVPKKEEEQNWAKLLVPLFLLLALLFGLRYASEWVRSAQKIPTAETSGALPQETSTPLANTPLPDGGAEDETGLRLVGVDYSEPPVALLEDLKTGRTYFARTNDRVKNAKIQKILKNKIIVSLNGKTVELQ